MWHIKITDLDTNEIIVDTDFNREDSSISLIDNLEDSLSTNTMSPAKNSAHFLHIVELISHLRKTEPIKLDNLNDLKDPIRAGSKEYDNKAIAEMAELVGELSDVDKQIILHRRGVLLSTLNYAVAAHQRKWPSNERIEFIKKLQREQGSDFVNLFQRVLLAGLRSAGAIPEEDAVLMDKFDEVIAKADKEKLKRMKPSEAKEYLKSLI